MILFHVAALDFNEPEIRSRAWLPVLALRRAGHAASIVHGDVASERLAAARCLVLAGGASADMLRAAQKATASRIPVILDIGSAQALISALAGPHRQPLIETAALAGIVTASTSPLARLVEASLGVPRVVVVPDLPDTEDGVLAGLRSAPGAMLQALAQWIDSAMRDGVARVRRGRAGAHGAKRILWFGAGRQPSGEGGVAELLLAACDLADLAEEMPIRLDVVGRSPRAARRFLKQLPVPLAFYRYAPWRVRQRLRKADACLLPNGGDPPSLARAPGRAALAAAFGVPVVAASPASPLLPALRNALADQPRRRGEKREVDPAAGWRQAVEAAQAAPERPADVVPPVPGKLRVLLLLQQFQDIDLIVPIAEAASAQPDMDVRVAVLSKIAIPALRRLRQVCGNGAGIEFWDGADLLAKRIAKERVAADVAVTASEGPGAGARFARAFVAASRSAHTRTLTMQHGLDNGGLTFGPQIRQAFISDMVLTWGGAHRLAGTASPATKAKAIPVGCPKHVFRPDDFPDFPFAGRTFIAVFENLHWYRYNDRYRTQFVADLAATAEAAPDIQFVVKPHMGGQWFVRGGAATPLPANVEIAHPAAPRWRRFTADAFLVHASAVITTPSTIALDAARYGVPAALVTYGIAAANYQPMPQLEQSADWLQFVDQIRRGSYDRTKLDAFFAAAVVPGDAVARIIATIRMAAARQAPADIVAALQNAPHSVAAS